MTTPNPQLENGYLKIANELVEALSKTDLSGQEFRVLLSIIRKTYGFNKKSDHVSRSQFMELTGIDNKHRISQLTNNLYSKNIIDRKTKIGKTTKFSINKNYSNWEGYNPLENVNGSMSNPLGKVNGSPLRKPNPPVKKNEPTKDTYTKDNKDIPVNLDLPKLYFDLSLNFHQKQKKNGYYHKDFKKELSQNSKVVKNGAEVIDKLIRLDNETLEDIKATLRFALKNDFWQGQVISLSGLRKKSKSNGNTKYFNIKNAMQNKNKNRTYTLDELAELGIKPREIEGNFKYMDNNRYKPSEKGKELIQEVKNGR
jgi:phage replication O-like protein O